ncbi:hypothetical protein POVCU2_0096050 [Plasmodium ovale curtisi]|uniref:Uncharacterized protein n=1 Tax=Plasmodium ovale curtisi TaxID=864141 RepID=A0A1A8W7Q7_PLAOA|nr:hypothetical protein POVCU1_014190 [Plasmodium ovale curtisi]SBS95471.1 hypothetical protein POVCU2_0096050 [Plasmodium ovale curtisi]
MDINRLISIVCTICKLYEMVKTLQNSGDSMRGRNKLDDVVSHKLENSAVKKDHEGLSDQKKKRNEKEKKGVNQKDKEEEDEGNNEGDNETGNAGRDKSHAQDYKEHYDGEHTTIHEGHEPATEHEIEM